MSISVLPLRGLPQFAKVRVYSAKDNCQVFIKIFNAQLVSFIVTRSCRGMSHRAQASFNGLNAICIVFIPINCVLDLEKEGITSLKTSETCQPVTKHDKALISCVLVSLSNNCYYY